MAEPSKSAPIHLVGFVLCTYRESDAEAPYLSRSLSQAPVDDLNWEPDGVTLHVRFCEGPGTTEGMVEIMWHRRETRRKLRRQSSTYSHPENPVYSPMLKCYEEGNTDGGVIEIWTFERPLAYRATTQDCPTRRSTGSRTAPGELLAIPIEPPMKL